MDSSQQTHTMHPFSSAESGFVVARRMKRSGFTLIELLIVIIIIGVLAALVLPYYGRNVASSRQATAKAQLVAIQQAQEVYKFQFGSYTSNTASLSNWLSTVGCYTFTIISAGAASFTAQAQGNIDSDATLDQWTIDQDGTLTNVVNDVAS